MNDKLPAIRHQPYKKLKRALDKVVAKQPELAGACALIERPLILMQELGASAYDALDNDIRAIERIQLTIQIAASDTYEIRNALSDALEHHRGRPVKQPPCEQGLLDLGELVIVALAAGRVGHRLERSGDYVDVVEALAIASLPAQAFTRALNAGLDYMGLAALLSGISHKEPQYARLRALAPTLLNPCDAALFNCIQNLLVFVKEQVDFVEIGESTRPREWDGAVSEVIARIRPEGRDRLLVELKEGQLGNSEFAGHAKQFDRVVFVSHSEDSTHVEADIPCNSSDPSSFSIRIPPDARAGWIGLQTEDMREQLVRHREKLVARLKKQNKKHVCLKGDAIPLDRLRDTTYLPASPHFYSSAAWGVRILDVEWRKTDNPGLRLVVSLSRPLRARRVSVRLTDAHDRPYEKDLRFDEERLTASLVIPPGYVSPLNGTVSLYVRDDEHPDDVITVEYDASADDTTSEEGSTDIQENDGPEVLGMVILRHAFVHDEDGPVIQPANVAKSLRIDRVGKTQADDALKTAQDRLGNRFNLKEIKLPWIGDKEQALSGEKPNMDGPASTTLLEHLDKMATLTVGGEDHVFVSIVPRADADTSFLKVARSEAARALVICTPDRLDEATEIAANTGESVQERRRTDRLRVIGNIQDGKVTLTEPSRVESRIAGTGGDYLTGIVAAGYRADGTKVFSQRLRTVNPTRSGGFMSLLPVDDEISSVQLLYKPDIFAVEFKAVPEAVEAALTNVTDSATTYKLEGLVKRRITPARYRLMPSLHRPSGNPYIEITQLNAKKISWRYGHSRGIRPRVEIELRSGGVWRQVYSAPESSTSADIDFARAAPGLAIDGLRIIASDGWNTMIEEKNREELVAAGFVVEGAAAVIRPVGELQYWVDADQDIRDMVTWSFAKDDGEPGEPISELPVNKVFKIDAEFLGKAIVAKAGAIKTPPIKLLRKPKAFGRDFRLPVHGTRTLR